MKISYLLPVTCLCLAALGAGCVSTRASRIRENAALFASLDPFTKQLVSDGLFDHGFTPELLYLSMGKPNRVVASESERGHVEVWSYRNYLFGNGGAVKIGATTPGARPQNNTVVSSSAPGGPSLMSTKASPAQPTVTDVDDAVLGTLYIELVDGRVVAARVVQ
jgi:hypothetical protein